MTTDRLLMYDRLIGEVTPDGFNCLLAMTLEHPSPISLSSLKKFCRVKNDRTLKPALERCEDYGYAQPVAPLDRTKWTVTDVFKRIFGELIAAIATALGLQAPRQLDSANPTAAQAQATLSSPCVIYAPPLSLSDQIIDQNSDQNQKDRAGAQNPRDSKAVSALLDLLGVYEPKRSDLLKDSWVTVERIEAALHRSKHNPKRISSNPVPLAISELLNAKYRPAIDATAAQLADTPFPVSAANWGRSETGEGAESASEKFYEPESNQQPAYTGPGVNIWIAAQGELQLQMARATYDTWVKPTSPIGYADNHLIVAVPNQYSKDWLDQHLATTIGRIVTGIVGRTITVSFTVWSKP